MPQELNELPKDSRSLTTDEKFYAVIIPIIGQPYVISRMDAITMALALEEARDIATNAFVIKGIMWAISKGPTHRYLLGPNNQQIPLFQPEPTTEIDPTGSLLMESDEE